MKKFLVLSLIVIAAIAYYVFTPNKTLAAYVNNPEWVECAGGTLCQCPGNKVVIAIGKKSATMAQQNPGALNRIQCVGVYNDNGQEATRAQGQIIAANYNGINNGTYFCPGNQFFYGIWDVLNGYNGLYCATLTFPYANVTWGSGTQIAASMSNYLPGGIFACNQPSYGIARTGNGPMPMANWDTIGCVTNMYEPGPPKPPPPPPPPSPPTASVSVDPASVTIGANTPVTLSWSNTNATAASIDNDIGMVAIGSGTTTVTPNKTVTYTQTVSGPGGSATASATVIAIPDVQPPSAPINLTAKALSTTEIKLDWTASSDNVGVTGYNVYNADTNQLINPTPFNYWTVTGLTCGTNYKFYVRAYDAAGNLSPNSNVATSKTLDCPPTPDTNAPTAPSNVKLSVKKTSTSGPTCFELTLAWDASKDDIGISGYSIYNASDNKLVTTTKDTTYTFKGIKENSSYDYYVTAHDAAGNVSKKSETASAKTNACADPAPVVPVTKLSSTGAVLWVNILIALFMSGLVGYFIFRKSAE